MPGPQFPYRLLKKKSGFTQDRGIVAEEFTQDPPKTGANPPWNAKHVDLSRKRFTVTIQIQKCATSK